MVTLVGFGIVLCLLGVLVYVLKGFGWIMQRSTPAAPQRPSALDTMPRFASGETIDEGTPAAIAMALSMAESESNDEAAIAMALYLAHNTLHDIQDVRLTMVGQPTAWNSKSFGMNNMGF